MDQLNHLIDITFSDVEKFESSNRPRYTLQSLYTALDHQLQDGLTPQHEFDRMRYIVRKRSDLKLQIHAIETKPSLPYQLMSLDIPLYLCWIYTQRVYLQGRYSSMRVLICVEP